MNVRCEQLEEILERQDAAELAALAEHARQCQACALQVQLDREISAAAPGLRKQWESGHLWARIETALDEQEASRTSLRALPRSLSAQWRLAAAAAVLLAVTTASGWFAFHSEVPAKVQVALPVSIRDEQRLLSEKVMKEVEQAEAAYLASIDRLAAVAEPKLQRSETPLLAGYREKLILLDAAIRDLRAQTDGNRFHAQLRRELLEMYQAKQQTLMQVVQEDAR